MHTTAGGSLTGAPGSVQEALLSRARAAGTEADYELLCAAACIGFEFDPLLLAAVADVGELNALKRLDHAARQGVLASEGRTYRFQHHLMQEALYGGLHPTLREAYHLRIARTLDARDDGKGASAVSICTHALMGNDVDRALRHASAALAWSNEQAEGEATAAFAERVLTHADRLAPRDHGRRAAAAVGVDWQDGPPR